MVSKSQIVAPEHTAVRTSLWRALHLQIDSAPHIFSDDIGAKIVGEEGWQNRPDMDTVRSGVPRASIVTRARFVEDLVEEGLKKGVNQYVILGAGLDTFALRRKDLISRMQVFEVDQPGPQKWKRDRLNEMGMTIPKELHFVPVDFEAGELWWEELQANGFDKNRPAFVVSTGVSMYLTKEANMATLKQVATLAPHSTLAMTFMLPGNLLGEEERQILEFTMKKAAESNTPFLSFFSPDEIVNLAKTAGLKNEYTVGMVEFKELYFSNRTDGLKPPTAEMFLVATT